MSLRSEDMKYTIEDVDGLPILMRYGEQATNPSPTNAEFEFWQEILHLRERVKELEGLLSSERNQNNWR
jgi:hypothetical protein